MHLELVSAVDDPVKDHDSQSQQHEDNHLSRQRIRLELLRKVVVHCGHHPVVKKERVRDDYDLDCSDEHIKVFAWLLLSNQGE